MGSRLQGMGSTGNSLPDSAFMTQMLEYRKPFYTCDPAYKGKSWANSTSPEDVTCKHEELTPSIPRFPTFVTKRNV